jgi:hypothetical protein
MERARPFKATLRNLPIAGDVDTTNHPGEVWIKGLIPFKAIDFIGYKEQVAAAEVQQALTIGASTVIAANTLYKFSLGNTAERDASWNKQFTPWGAVSPATLTGTAATDRMNLYLIIAKKINSQYSPRQYFAGAKCTLTHVGSAAFTIPTGRNDAWDGTPVWVRGATSGTVGFIRANADSTATATVLHVYNGILPVVGDIFTVIASPFNPDVIGAGGPSTAVTVVTQGQGITVVDKPDYYSADGTHLGKTGFFNVAGFAATDFTVTTAGVYQVGQGYRLLQEVPRRETTSSNLMAGGNFWFPTNETPLGANNYNIIDIYYDVRQNSDAKTDTGGSGQAYQRIYAKNDAAGYAAFLAAIAAL